MIGGESPVTNWIWTVLATIGGSISALSFQPYKRMTRAEIGLSLVVSFTFALFFGPLVGYWIFGTGSVNWRLMGAVMWGMAAGAHYLIPLGIRKLGLMSGMASEKDAPPVVDGTNEGQSQ